MHNYLKICTKSQRWCCRTNKTSCPSLVDFPNELLQTEGSVLHDSSLIFRLKLGGWGHLWKRHDRVSESGWNETHSKPACLNKLRGISSTLWNGHKKQLEEREKQDFTYGKCHLYFIKLERLILGIRELWVVTNTVYIAWRYVLL